MKSLLLSLDSRARKIRRLAVILQMAHGEAIEDRCNAEKLDRLAELDEQQEPKEWQKAVAAAVYYLREIGRTTKVRTKP